jgi:hypothetical protein
MADESDLYEQFSDFSYRKILTALIKWEEEGGEERAVWSWQKGVRNFLIIVLYKL